MSFAQKYSPLIDRRRPFSGLQHCQIQTSYLGTCETLKEVQRFDSNMFAEALFVYLCKQRETPVPLLGPGLSRWPLADVLPYPQPWALQQRGSAGAVLRQEPFCHFKARAVSYCLCDWHNSCLLL